VAGDAVDYTYANVGLNATPSPDAVDYTYADVISTATTGVQIRPSTQVMREGATQGQVLTWDDGAGGVIYLDPDASWASAVAAKQDMSEKGQPNGYASLDGTGKVPAAQLGTGTADSTTVLHGDGTWGAGSGVAVADNGDGTFTISGSGVTDNGDGTFTISA